MFVGQHEERRLSSSCADPFQSTLPLIIDYVGIGHWMFLSEISRSWLAAYRKLCYQEIATLSESGLPGGAKILTSVAHAIVRLLPQNHVYDQLRAVACIWKQTTINCNDWLAERLQ
jgi:hypothetical protein